MTNWKSHLSKLLFFSLLLFFFLVSNKYAQCVLAFLQIKSKSQVDFIDNIDNRCFVSTMLVPNQNSIIVKPFRKIRLSGFSTCNNKIYALIIIVLLVINFHIFPFVCYYESNQIHVESYYYKFNYI